MLPERRQVVEVVIQCAVTEYRFVGGTCTCGRVQRSAVPEGITATVHSTVRGVGARGVPLTQSQLLPYQGTAELFQELAGIALSPGTLQRAATVAATHLEAPVAAIRDALLTALVAHADETGGRVNGDRHWLHVLSTAGLKPSAYFPGVLVHDHGSAYARYQCLHAFCNAHRAS